MSDEKQPPKRNRPKKIAAAFAGLGITAAALTGRSDTKAQTPEASPHNDTTAPVSTDSLTTRLGALPHASVLTVEKDGRFKLTSPEGVLLEGGAYALLQRLASPLNLDHEVRIEENSLESVPSAVVQLPEGCALKITETGDYALTFSGGDAYRGDGSALFHNLIRGGAMHDMFSDSRAEDVSRKPGLGLNRFPFSSPTVLISEPGKPHSRVDTDKPAKENPPLEGEDENISAQAQAGIFAGVAATAGAVAAARIRKKRKEQEETTPFR